MTDDAGTAAGRMKIPRSLRLLASIGLLAALYIALESVSSLHAFNGLPFTAWDPGLGALFVALIRRPAAGALALFAGILVAETLLTPASLHWAQVVAIAAIISLTYLGTALLLTGRTAFDPRLDGMPDILRLLGAGLSGALISGVLMTALFVFSGDMRLADVSSAAFSHVVGDAIGIAVTTPLLLRLMATRVPSRWRELSGFIPDALMLVAASALYFWLVTGAPHAEGHRYFYLLFIPAVFTAVRHGLTGATCVLAVTQFALVIFLNRFDFNAANFAAHQSMMLALTATALLVGSIVSERNFLEAEAQGARNRLSAMAESSARAARFNLVNGMASALAHELSQPLTAARARARIVERIATGASIEGLDAQLTKLVEQIDVAAAILRRMRDFVGKSSSSEATAAWSEIATKTRELMMYAAQHRQVKLTFSQNRPAISLHCDTIQIEQVLANLIGNAIDAIAAAGISNGHVEIVAEEQTDGALEVVVRDNGPGISPALATSIFDPLVTTKAEGLGLGLAISAMIVESHHGRLWIANSQAGATEFRFRLPAADGARPGNEA